MNIDILYSAVDLVRASGHRNDIREAAFMRAYPVMLSTARLPADSPVDALLRTASLVYAWIPETLQPETSRMDLAAEAFASACQNGAAVTAEIIEPIADCLGSLVAAAKLLHVANPAVYPSWETNVEQFRLQTQPSGYHMSQTRNYLDFAAEVREIAAHPLFLTFHHEYCTAYQARLQRLRIPAYPLTEPRVIESAAAELAER